MEINVEKIARDLIAEMEAKAAENQTLLQGMKAGVIEFFNRLQQEARAIDNNQPTGETSSEEPASSPAVQGHGDPDTGT